MIKFLKVYVIYMSSGLLVSVILMLGTGVGISELWPWGAMQYSQLFVELFETFSDMSLYSTIYAGVAIRLLMTVVFAGIGVRRFKVGLIAEVGLSVLNIVFSIWLAFNAALH
jgi:hypothetical protein